VGGAGKVLFQFGWQFSEGMQLKQREVQQVGDGKTALPPRNNQIQW